MIDQILDILGDGCLTTSILARRLDADQSEVRAACVAAARAGKLELVSYGWDFSLAWASPDAILPHGEYYQERSAPWYMSRRDRWAELSG